MKLLFVDCETTGVKAGTNGLIQLSGAMQIREGRFLVVTREEQFDYCLTPFPDDVIEESALMVNGITRDDLKAPTRISPTDAHAHFKKKMDQFVDRYDKNDKFYFVGFNSPFDESFVRAWFDKCGDKYYGAYAYWPTIDVAQMAAIYLREKRAEMPNFKLATVARALGLAIDSSKLHDAKYDVDLTISVFDKIMGATCKDLTSQTNG
jgi:DNA polymerase-3 subunit epsilon